MARWTKLLVICATAAVAMATNCFGQQPAYDPFRAADNQSPAAPSPRQNLITSVEFVKTPVTDVLRIISDLTGLSIITSEEVATKPPSIDLWIKNMTPQEALQEVARLAGLIAEQRGNVVHVMTFSDYARIYGVERQVISIKHGQATKIADALRPFVKDSEAKVIADEASNKLVLLVPAPLSMTLASLAEKLDSPFEQETVRVVKLEHLEASQIAPLLEEFLRTGAGDRQTHAQPSNSPGANAPEAIRAGDEWLVQFMVEKELNTIVLRGRPLEVERTADLIAQLDIDPAMQIVSYPFHHIDAVGAYASLEPLLEKRRQGAGGQGQPPRVIAAVSEQNNSIVVEGSSADQAYVAQMVAALDQPVGAGAGGVRVYRLENASAAEVASVLQDLVAGDEQPLADRTAKGLLPEGPLGGGAVGVELDQSAQVPRPSDLNAVGSFLLPPQVIEAPEINAVIVRGSAAQHEELMGLIQTLDRPRDQVLLEVTLVTVTSTNGFNLGVELSGASINGEDTEMVGFSVFGIGRANASTGALRIAQPPPLGLNYAVFNTGDFSVVLNALETIGDTRIKSSPTILIQDNAEATISQLDEEPFEVTSQGDATTITSFGGFVEAGTTLTVLPHVSSFDWLRLDYAITFSSFGSRTAEQTAANLPPPRRQNVLQGTVRVPSDYTVVIGGLANGREDRNIDQIPFLGNIPLLGELLKNRSENNQQATLFVFIRPVILRDAGFEDLLHLSEHEIRRAELERGQDLSNPLKMMVPLDTVLPKTEVQP